MLRQPKGGIKLITHGRAISLLAQRLNSHGGTEKARGRGSSPLSDVSPPS